MIGVHSEGDKVVIVLGARRRDMSLGMIEAEDFAAALERMADSAAVELPSVIRGEQWACQVESFDRKVFVRFYPPSGSTCTRVIMPPAAARKLADEVRFKRQQASYGIRFQQAASISRI